MECGTMAFLVLCGPFLDDAYGDLATSYLRGFGRHGLDFFRDGFSVKIFCQAELVLADLVHDSPRMDRDAVHAGSLGLWHSICGENLLLDFLLCHRFGSTVQDPLAH